MEPRLYTEQILYSAVRPFTGASSIFLKISFFLLLHPRGCEVLRWAHLRVCEIACLKNHTSKLHGIFCTCQLWP